MLYFNIFQPYIYTNIYYIYIIYLLVFSSKVVYPKALVTDFGGSCGPPWLNTPIIGNPCDGEICIEIFVDLVDGSASFMSEGSNCPNRWLREPWLLSPAHWANCSKQEMTWKIKRSFCCQGWFLVGEPSIHWKSVDLIWSSTCEPWLLAGTCWTCRVNTIQLWRIDHLQSIYLWVYYDIIHYYTMNIPSKNEVQ